MENQTESAVGEEAAGSNLCSVETGEEPAAFEVDTCRLNLDHFLLVSFRELQLRHEHLRREECKPAVIAAFNKLLADWARQGASLVEEARFADKDTRARLREALLWVSQTGRSLRRSPRLAIAVSVWLRREDSRRTWEEDTWTSTMSRHGAAFVCNHPVEVGGTVILMRKDKGIRAAAHVVYSRTDSEGRRQVGVEFIDRDDFWD